jgi:hypothetical protein
VSPSFLVSSPFHQYIFLLFSKAINEILASALNAKPSSQNLKMKMLKINLLALATLVGSAFSSSAASDVIEGAYWAVEDFSRGSYPYPSTI